MISGTVVTAEITGKESFKSPHYPGGEGDGRGLKQINIYV